MTCTFSGCENPRHARGFCQKHYLRMKRHGDAAYVPAAKVCTFEGCHRRHDAQGLCSAHRGQISRGANLRPVRVVVFGSTEERFETYIDRTGDCWVWTGGVSSTGYAHMRHDGGTVLIHRYGLRTLERPDS